VEEDEEDSKPSADAKDTARLRGTTGATAKASKDVWSKESDYY
jgi:hypothetical protein